MGLKLQANRSYSSRNPANSRDAGANWVIATRPIGSSQAYLHCAPVDG
jgi:hypothetical protein